MRSRRSMLAASVLAPLTAALGSVADAAKKGNKGKRKKGAGKKPRAPKGSPNFVVIVTDDMRASDWQALPKTKALLAPRGVWFPNFLIPTPTCSPSRTSLLTGMHAHNHGVLRSNGPHSGWAAFHANRLEQRTIALRLHRAGYRTMLVGKYQNGYGGRGGVPVGWDEWCATSATGYVNFSVVENGKLRKYRGRRYLTDYMRSKAVRFISTTPRDTPLLLNMNFKAPHSPATPAPRDRNAFAGVAVDRAIPSLSEDDTVLSGKPEWVRQLAPIPRDALDKDEQLRLGTLRSVDQAIAAVVNRLRTTGRLDNTYLFVLSDNGWMRGEHRILDKGVPYASSVCVPMLAWGPRFAASGTDDRIVANIDIAPTIAAAAGIGFPGVDGRNLLDDWSREEMLLEGWSNSRPGWRALRGKTWLYVEYDTDEREYYEYDPDPYELTNRLADWSGHTPTLAEVDADRLAERLNDAKTCRGKACP
ncbi:MAG: sulfatase [Thermomicrobiales bacterium]|nr:sulfatase [Thermomicrobiales bacterium]